MNHKLGDKWGKYTIVGIQKIIHGKFFPNKEITHRVSLKGVRGAKATADVESGRIMTLRHNYGYFEGETVLDGRN